MNNKMIILSSAVAIVIIIAIVYFVASNRYSVIDTKTYQAPDGSFSFQYPEFKGWKPYINANGDQRSIWFSAPFESVIAPSMKIKASLQPSPIMHPDILPKNPAGITYTDKDANGWLSFVISAGTSTENTKKVKVVEIGIPTNEDNGFSSAKMAKMIIETFKENIVEQLK